jgi:two-component system response regulator FixJ
MTQMRQKCVVFVGTSILVRETLDQITTRRGVPMRALGSVRDGCEFAVQKKNALLVVELDGNAGQELQWLAQLTHQRPQSCVLAIVDRGDIPTTVQAMRAGADNCLERPVDPELLNSALGQLLHQIDIQSDDSVTPLTRMETTVLEHIVQGRTNRQIAASLHRSPRTVEVHRRHIMCKLGVGTVVDLIKAASARGFLRESNGVSQGSEADGDNANGPAAVSIHLIQNEQTRTRDCPAAPPEVLDCGRQVQ